MKHLITIVLFLVMPVYLYSQIFDKQCDYSHASIFNNITAFQNGIYASTVASKDERVTIPDNLSYIILDGTRYSLKNPEYFPMNTMPSTEQVLFESNDAMFIGITLNGRMLTVTVLYEVISGKLRQVSYTYGDGYDAFSQIKSRINSSSFSNTGNRFSSYGVSFNYQAGWKTEKEVIEDNIVYYASCEKDDEDSVDLYTILIFKFELDLVEAIDGTLDEINEISSITKEQTLNSRYLNYTGKIRTFSYSILGEIFIGEIFSFYHNNNTIIIMKLADSKYGLKNNFKIIENSIEFN